MTDLAYMVVKAASSAGVALDAAPADPSQLDGRWTGLDIGRGVVHARYRGDPGAVEALGWAIGAVAKVRGDLEAVEVGVYRSPAPCQTPTADVKLGDLLIGYRVTPDAFGRIASGQLSPCDALRRVTPSHTKKG